VCNDAAFTAPHNNSKQTVPQAIFLFCCQYYSVTTWELGVLFLFYHMHTYLYDLYFKEGLTFQMRHTERWRSCNTSLNPGQDTKYSDIFLTPPI
jgi:hypothetical protein